MYTVRMGDRGRLVVPAELRERLGLHPGTVLVFIESSNGLVLLTRDQLKNRVCSEMEGLNLVDELLEDRRRQAGDGTQPERCFGERRRPLAGRRRVVTGRPALPGSRRSAGCYGVDGRFGLERQPCSEHSLRLLKG